MFVIYEVNLKAPLRNKNAHPISMYVEKEDALKEIGIYRKNRKVAHETYGIWPPHVQFIREEE